MASDRPKFLSETSLRMNSYFPHCVVAPFGALTLQEESVFFRVKTLHEKVPRACRLLMASVGEEREPESGLDGGRCLFSLRFPHKPSHTDSPPNKLLRKSSMGTTIVAALGSQWSRVRFAIVLVKIVVSMLLIIASEQ